MSLDKGVIGVIVGNFSGTLIVDSALLGVPGASNSGSQFDRGLLREIRTASGSRCPDGTVPRGDHELQRLLLPRQLSDVSEAGLDRVGRGGRVRDGAPPTVFRMAWPAFAY